MTALDSTGSDGRLLTTQQAAEFIGLSVSCLANYRCTGQGPAFYKCGRYVKYDENDLKAWQRSRRYTSTSQASAA